MQMPVRGMNGLNPHEKCRSGIATSEEETNANNPDEGYTGDVSALKVFQSGTIPVMAQ